MSKQPWLLCFLALSIIAAQRQQCDAQSKAAMARELVEFVTRRFSKEVAEEGSEILTRKVESLLVKYGDEVAEAVRKVGPRSIQLLDDAAAEGVQQSARLLAKHGDDAIWVVGNQGRRAIAARLGDDAAEAMIKHGEIAEPVLEMAGQSAALALRNLSTKSGRQVKMMLDEGEWAKIGRTSELLSVVGKYGDSAMNFVWKNKGALLVGTALAAFLSDPEPFIQGSKELATVAANVAIEPIAKEIGARTNWTLAICVLAGLCAGYVALKRYTRAARR
jgi:hypothetical protein